MSDDRPTIPGTAGWPDVPLLRAALAFERLKLMQNEGECLPYAAEGRETAALVFTAAGEDGIDPEDVRTLARHVVNQFVKHLPAFDGREIGVLLESVWLDAFLLGVATARRLWADEETGVVELRPEEESDDAS